ncbi:collagenase [Paraburkholderia sp. NMBU_R16]|uniref:collagenase n=1 Tax=Paraburkholderia sp. NMBU_R16 TaxID=2698676 RepID=UPI001567A25B|nr:collagenase [Paraburkholderia sp. NMBU_R16]NRO98904.1 collagenase [Paraburkholderia sp. NMBU_R16]
MERLFSALCGGLLLLALAMSSVPALAASGPGAPIGAGSGPGGAKLPPMPRPPTLLPRSREEWLFDLAPSDRLRPELMTPEMRRRARAKRQAGGEACPSMDAMAGLRGEALAERVATLADSACANAFFEATREQARQLFGDDNLRAVATRFATEGEAYGPGNRALLNLTLFLRAAYYLANQGTAPPLPDDMTSRLRPVITRVLTGSAIGLPNPSAATSAGELITLIVNMHDESAYLPFARQWVTRFTNSAQSPAIASTLDEPGLAYAFTAILKVFYFAHYRHDAAQIVGNDPSYALALYGFVKANKRDLLAARHASYLLNQAASEAFRFATYPSLLPTIRPLIQDALADSTMAGPDRLVWLAAAQAVQAYDADHCSVYGTCGFEGPLADAILARRYRCANGAIALRTASLTPSEADQACTLMRKEAPRFHEMLRTHEIPVADDHNTTLEVVVFSDNTEYENYSPVLFGNDTDNGGVYLEGDPAAPKNQARFIAFVATWLKPHFEVWNLRHEFVHYLDGRFDLHGDFEASTNVPTVWYIEGLAEYISRGNDDPESIEAAKTGRYRLSEIFANSYTMDDYVSRAYRWGYMAVRFVFERHPEVLSTILPMFRNGDYAAYWSYMSGLPSQLDGEFAQWVLTTTADGTSEGD